MKIEHKDLDWLQREAILGTMGAWTKDMLDWMRENNLGEGESALNFRLTKEGELLKAKIIEDGYQESDDMAKLDKMGLL